MYCHYTLFKDEVDALVFGEPLTDFITIPEYLAFTVGWDEITWAWGYSALMIVILLYSFVSGWRFLKVPLLDLVRKNTDQLVFRSVDGKDTDVANAVPVSKASEA